MLRKVICQRVQYVMKEGKCEFLGSITMWQLLLYPIEWFGNAIYTLVLGSCINIMMVKDTKINIHYSVPQLVVAMIEIILFYEAFESRWLGLDGRQLNLCLFSRFEIIFVLFYKGVLPHHHYVRYLQMEPAPKGEIEIFRT